MILLRTVPAFAFLTLVRFLIRKSKDPEMADSAALFTGSSDFMMDSSFSNLIFGENAGFSGMILNIQRNPSYFFSLLFSEKTLVYFLQIMLPLLFLPFITTKIRRHFLTLPFVIMNLVIGSGYRYAAEMGYHYTFGTVTLLIFLAIINCADLNEKDGNTQGAAAILESSGYKRFAESEGCVVIYKKNQSN